MSRFASATLEVGDQAPLFTLPNQEGCPRFARSRIGERTRASGLSPRHLVTELPSPVRRPGVQLEAVSGPRRHGHGRRGAALREGQAFHRRHRAADGPCSSMTARNGEGVRGLAPRRVRRLEHRPAFIVPDRPERHRPLCLCGGLPNRVPRARSDRGGTREARGHTDRRQESAVRR